MARDRAEEPAGEAARRVARSDAQWARRVRRFRAGLFGAVGLGVLTLDAAVPGESDVLRLVAALAAAAAFLASALTEARGKDGRWWAAIGAVAVGVAFGRGLVYRPGLAFALGLGVVGLLTRSERPLRSGGLDRAAYGTLGVWGAVGPALLVAAGVAALDAPSPRVEIAATLTVAFAAGLGLYGVFARPAPLPAAVRASVAGWVACAATAVGALEDHATRLVALLVAASLPMLADVYSAPQGKPFGSWLSPIAARPPLLLAATFGGTALLGTLALWLPLSAEPGVRISGLDAFFTAVSATCVTGLIVLDTPNAFSGFGEAAILVLIQVGGLGIMTFSTAALSLLRRRPSLEHERALLGLFVARSGHDPQQAVKDILRVTFFSELAGAAALTLLFALRHGDSWGTAAWRGVFTAVSAFCNAGFALQTQSLIPYAGDPVVLHVVGLLIVVGGLGPLAVTSFAADGRRLPAAVRLIGLTSVLLLAGGAVLFGAFEWQASLKGLGLLDKLHNAWFQSVTTRTAGFNSVPFEQLRPETQVTMAALMFIGGSPGSTAGGIKTTTFAVLVLSVFSVVRGRPEVVLAGRRIRHTTFYRSVAIAALGLLACLAVWVMLLLTQAIPPMVAGFEAVSALGTVGLSVGGTGQLDGVGKLVIAGAMFAGRLGPLGVLFLFAAQERPPPWKHPEIGVPVG